MAFKLKAGDLSPVFETELGFHFLQVIERRGEQVQSPPYFNYAATYRSKFKKSTS